MTVPAGTITFLYDADGRRIQRSIFNSNLPNKYFGKMVYTYGAWMHKYVYAGNILVAKTQSRWNGDYIAPTRLWYHADHLGSTRIMTRSTGARTNSYDYEAYGASALLGGSASNDRTFTGHIEDTDLGLVYMVARYYDASLGRFISPDSLVPDINNPQDFNRYSYGNNNPISNTDPTGHACQSSGWGLLSSISNWVWPSSGYSASHFLDQYPHHTLSSFNPVHYPSFNRLQSSLNILGWTPGIGAPFNALNAMISAGDGRWSDAIANTSLALSPPAWFLAAMTKASKVTRTVRLGYNVEKSAWGGPAKSLAGGWAKVNEAKTALPELRISASKYPDLAENIFNAQMAGHPTVLTHGGEAVNRANRNAALHQPYRNFVPNIGRGLSRDEYPFASSLEGGAGAWVGHIPVDQQQAQGGLIRAMNLRPGDQYRVGIVP